MVFTYCFPSLRMENSDVFEQLINVFIVFCQSFKVVSFRTLNQIGYY